MAGKFENWPPDVPEKEGREGYQSELEAEEEAAAAGEMEVKLVHGAGKRRGVNRAFLDLRYGCPSRAFALSMNPFDRDNYHTTARLC